MSELNFGVIGTSKKEDEQRVAIHPDHLQRLPEKYRKKLVFEEGYGAPFGVSDAEIALQTGGVASRSELLSGAIPIAPSSVPLPRRQLIAS